MQQQRTAASTIITYRELLTATGLPAPRIEFFVRIGVVVPVRAGTGRGSMRVYSAENILEVQQADELGKAGLTGSQLQRLFATQRAQLADLTPSVRLVARYKSYIATIVHLADVFGAGPGFDVWHRTQTVQLRKMERALARAGEQPGPDLDHQLLDLFVAAKADASEPALAG